MCGANSPRKTPRPPPPIEPADVELGRQTAPADIRRRRKGGRSSLRTGLNTPGAGASGLAIPGRK